MASANLAAVQSVPQLLARIKRESRFAQPRRGSTRSPITWPKGTTRLQGITDEDLRAWARTFPMVSVQHVLVTLQCWLLCTPSHRLEKYNGDLRPLVEQRLSMAQRLGHLPTTD